MPPAHSCLSWLGPQKDRALDRAPQELLPCKTVLLIALPWASLADTGLSFLLVWICEFRQRDTSYTHFVPTETLAHIRDIAFPLAQCLLPL